MTDQVQTLAIGFGFMGIAERGLIEFGPFEKELTRQAKVKTPLFEIVLECVVVAYFEQVCDLVKFGSDLFKKLNRLEPIVRDVGQTKWPNEAARFQIVQREMVNAGGDLSGRVPVVDNGRISGQLELGGRWIAAASA